MIYAVKDHIQILLSQLLLYDYSSPMWKLILYYII